MNLHAATSVAALLALTLGLRAGSLVTGVELGVTDAPDSRVSSLTFGNKAAAVTQFSTGDTTYRYVDLADTAYVRRNAGTARNSNNSSVWYTGSGNTFAGTYETGYAALLLGNNIYAGSDNTFANGRGSAELGNIERLDFVFTGGITATAGMAFSVWDRGEAGLHDPFKIAVITGWNESTQTATRYATLTGMDGTWGAATDPIAASTYSLFRYGSGDNLASNRITDRSETGTQALGGVVFTLADLGVAPGTKIYGYSIFGYDVTAANNLLSYQTFSTSTNGTTGSGGLDLASINGALFVQIPEPSTYALLLGAGTLALAARRRFRRR